VANGTIDRGVLPPDDLDWKTNEPSIDVLRSKHPNARIPDISVLEEYEILPDLVEVDIIRKKRPHSLPPIPFPFRSVLY
jgi:hypothetical protein